MWFCALPNFQYLKHVFRSIFFKQKPINLQREICQLTKHKHTSFPKSTYKLSKPFTMIHSDVWSSSWVPNSNHAKWFITFMDHTWSCWVYLLKEKFEVRSVFINFHFIIHTQFQTQIQILPTTSGMKYSITSWETFCRLMA